MQGCINPKAVNYDSSADVDDYSCLYLFKNQGNCHLFKDLIPTSTDDKSFTLSYSLRSNSWVFFHDYIPDFYIHTHDNLYALATNRIFKVNDGIPGKYLDEKKNPFFIDIIFRSDGDMILESIQWVSEFISSETDQKFNTLTHISVWNNTQHTGRVAANQIFKDLQYAQMRRTKGEWSFNEIRDIIITEGVSFLNNIFNNYSLDTSKTNSNIPWYSRKLMQDSWFCVRFEFDNINIAKVLLHDTTIQALKTSR